MGKRKLAEAAYLAGFKDAQASLGVVLPDDMATHAQLGFDGWYASRQFEALATAQARLGQRMQELHNEIDHAIVSAARNGED